MFPLGSLTRRVAQLIRLGAPFTLILRVWRWIVGYIAREFAFQLAAVLALAIAGIALLGWTGGTLGTIITVILAAGLALELRYAWASYRSAAAIERELAEEVPGEPAASRFPRSHLLIPLLMLYAGGVRHERGVVFHREPKRILRLDVYKPKDPPAAGERRPAIVQVHGGGWILGSRVEQGIPLLNHLATNGWVGFNADYRLSPRATMPDHVIDVKRAIAWVREHADDYGVDPERICITGGSAGGHLSALAALTVGDPALQPGFEEADTSVRAAVAFYGLYDLLDSERRYYPGLRSWLMEQIVFKRTREEDPEGYRAASPTHRVHPDAPPFMVFHGEHDTLVPAADAREFARRLEAVSRQPVLYVELPGSEHAFDLAPSLRTARVVEGIERFLRGAVDAPRAGEERDEAGVAV